MGEFGARLEEGRGREWEERTAPGNERFGVKPAAVEGAGERSVAARDSPAPGTTPGCSPIPTTRRTTPKLLADKPDEESSSGRSPRQRRFSSQDSSW